MNSDARRRTIVKWGLITSLVNRGAVAVVPLLMVPLALKHLGAANYGVWIATTSLTSIVGFADLGVGVGLMTKLGALGLEPGTQKKARELIAGGYLATGAVSALLISVLLVVPAFRPWSEILGIVNETDPLTTNIIILVTVGAVCISIPLSLIVRIQYGLGQQTRSNLWQTVASFSSLAVAVVVVTASEQPTLFVAAVAFCPPFFNVLNTLTFLRSRNGSAYVPSFGPQTYSEALGLLKVGAPFLAITLLMSISISLDPWVISRSLGAESVAEFAVPQKMFVALTGIAVTVGMPLWPLYSRAVITGDHGWISKMTSRLVVAVAAATAVLGIGAVLLAPAIVHYWLDDQIPVNRKLWICLAIFALLQAAASPLFMVQNGGNYLRPQLWGYALFAVISLPAKLVLAPAVGGEGVVIISILGYLLLIWPACLTGYAQTLRNARANSRVSGRVT